MIRLKHKKGISLVELVIVITIVGIISTPIINQVLMSIRQNYKSKQMLDATLLAQKYTESIQVEGDDIIQDVFPSEQVTTKQDELNAGGQVQFTDANYSKYSIRLTKLSQTEEATGSFAVKGFYNYYLFDMTQNNKLIVKKLKYDNGATAESELEPSNFSAQFTFAPDRKSASLPLNDGYDDNDDYSLVFGNNDKLEIYSNKEYRYNEADKQMNISDDLKVKYGEITDTEVFPTNCKFVNYVRFNKDADISNDCSKVNINIYNNKSGVNVHAFYDSSKPTLSINTKYDKRTVIIHDIAGSDSMNTVTYKNTGKYTIRIYDDLGNLLVKRDIEYIE